MAEESSSFFERVYEVVKEIPHGKVTTYGAIAKHLGTTRSSRMVGWALNNCHTLEDMIPAHRVVNRLGVLSGAAHFGTPTLMQELLENEGHIIEENQIKNFKEALWIPPYSEHD